MKPVYLMLKDKQQLWTLFSYTISQQGFITPAPAYHNLECAKKVMSDGENIETFIHELLMIKSLALSGGTSQEE